MAASQVSSPQGLTVPSLGWCQVSHGVFLQLFKVSALHRVSSARTDELYSNDKHMFRLLQKIRPQEL